MTAPAPIPLASRSAQLMESSEFVHHILVDVVIKTGIVVAALVALALGMRAIWRRSARRRP
ncbi:hypothetical protein ACFVQ4_14110 [Streptomyces laurentii]|uniref:hypothetical protein n=1 Tax=Streptomyces laurentii TaxID=39478 RepID=UPI003692B0F6